MKLNQNSSNSSRKNTPELVGAPIRRQDPNKQNNTTNKQNISFNQAAPNRPGAPNRSGMPNRPGSKFNGPKSPGVRKPVSPNELLQLQKTNKYENNKQFVKNNEKQNN